MLGLEVIAGGCKVIDSLCTCGMSTGRTVSVKVCQHRNCGLIASCIFFAIRASPLLSNGT